MIKTGNKPIPVITYIAIMAVCFIINLPGVAVAPVEGKLREILHSSELEIQLLTTLPNFVIIPFVLLAGKLSDYKHKLWLIAASLTVFVASGIIYLCSSTFSGMIVGSCLLGAADGILIPFAMGFVVNTFEGKYRTRNLGIKSAVSNFGTVVAGFVVGWLIAVYNWHLPFVIYLVAIVPLVLCYWLKYIPGFGDTPLVSDNPVVSTQSGEVKGGLEVKKIWALIGNNFFITLITFSIVIYFPQLIQGLGWSPKFSGIIMSVFFISVLSSGFVLPNILKLFKSFTFTFISILILTGFALIVFVKARWAMFGGSILTGFAFGIVQPLIYDKTSYAVKDPRQNIYALSLVLCALYIAIALEPFIISAIVSIFHIPDINRFAFILSFWMAIVCLILSFLFRNRFGYSIEKNYYS